MSRSFDLFSLRLQPVYVLFALTFPATRDRADFGEQRRRRPSGKSNAACRRIIASECVLEIFAEAKVMPLLFAVFIF